MHNTNVSVILNGEQSHLEFNIKSNTYNVAKNKNPHEFLRLNTGSTDGLSWQLAALGKSQILWVLCHAALRGRPMERFKKNETYSISR